MTPLVMATVVMMIIIIIIIIMIAIIISLTKRFERSPKSCLMRKSRSGLMWMNLLQERLNGSTGRREEKRKTGLNIVIGSGKEDQQQEEKTDDGDGDGDGDGDDDVFTSFSAAVPEEEEIEKDIEEDDWCGY